MRSQLITPGAAFLLFFVLSGCHRDVRIQVRDSHTNAPVPGVRVKYYDKQADLVLGDRSQQGFAGDTDENGRVVVRVPSRKSGKTITLESGDKVRAYVFIAPSQDQIAVKQRTADPLVQPDYVPWSGEEIIVTIPTK